MATFTLEQLKERHPNLQRRVVSGEQIQRESTTRRETAGNQFEEPSTSFLGKARNFATDIIGGGALAEGLGKTLAAPKLQRSLSEVEQRMSDTDLRLVERIREKKDRGEDTTRLENARAQLIEDMKKTRDVQEDFVNSLPTNEEIIGSAVRLGGTLAAPTLANKATALTGLGKGITGIGSGILRGAGAGALGGAIEGGIQGTGIGIAKDEGLRGVAASALSGVTIGGIGGGIFGGLLGGIQGYRISRSNKLKDFAVDLAMPKQTPKVKAEAIQRGRFENMGFLRSSKITPSKYDRKVASAIEDVVSPRNSLGDNIDAIIQKIDDTDNGVRTYIQENKIPFNANQLRSKLNAAKADSRLIFASDATAERTYNAVVDEFMDTIGKKDTAGLFEARQNFDQIPAIKKLLQSEGLGENIRKQIVLDIRRAANEYIADQLPKGNQYIPLMKQQSYALEALANIGEKNAPLIGKNGLQIITQKYPMLNWAIGVGAGSLLTGSVFGLGRAITGSSEQ